MNARPTGIYLHIKLVAALELRARRGHAEAYADQDRHDDLKRPDEDCDLFAQGDSPNDLRQQDQPRAQDQKPFLGCR